MGRVKSSMVVYWDFEIFDVPQKIWAQSVKLFGRILETNEQTDKPNLYIDLEKKTQEGGWKTPPPPSRDGIRDFQVVIKFRHLTKEKKIDFYRTNLTKIS